MVVVAPGWPKVHCFWDLVNLSSKPPLQLLHWPHLLKQPFMQKYHQNDTYKMDPTHNLDSLESFFEQVYESRSSIFEFRCQPNRTYYVRAVLISYLLSKI